MTTLDSLTALSDALEQRVAAASSSVAAIGWGDGRHISAIVWRPGVLVTSEQSLPRAKQYQAVLAGGASLAASLAGRDPTTNVAALRFSDGGASPPEVTLPRAAGGLALAIGSDGVGGCSVAFGGIERVGPAWDSQAGGRIDALIRLGLRLGRAAEGGPVIDAAGKLLGMSTYGPRRSVLVIPAATVARVMEPLLADGRIARGWLGVTLHPVALPRDVAARVEASSGLMVVSIAEDAPASQVLLPGDILLAIGRIATATVRDAASALGPETVGQELDLRLVRGGALTTVRTTIAARPA